MIRDVHGWARPRLVLLRRARPTAAVALIALVAAAPPPTGPSKVTVDATSINAAVDNGARFLAGTFTSLNGGPAADEPARQALAALCAYAVVRAARVHGPSGPGAPVVSSILDGLAAMTLPTGVTPQAVHAHALRAAALAEGRRPADRGMLRADVDWLVRADDVMSAAKPIPPAAADQGSPPVDAPPPPPPEGGPAPAGDDGAGGGFAFVPRAPSSSANRARPRGGGGWWWVSYHGRIVASGVDHGPAGQVTVKLVTPEGTQTAILGWGSPPRGMPPTKTPPVPAARPAASARPPAPARSTSQQPPADALSSETLSSDNAVASPPTGLDSAGVSAPASVPAPGDAAGSGPSVDGWDNVVAQCGVWGVSAGSTAGVTVPRSYWASVRRRWLASQLADGQWCASAADPSPRLAMDAAGVTALAAAGHQLGGPPPAAVAAALRWLSSGDQPLALTDPDPTTAGYTAFSIEQAATAAGLDRLGRHDWYAELAAQLLPGQRPQGFWGPDPTDPDAVADTAFRILFLSHRTRVRTPTTPEAPKA